MSEIVTRTIIGGALQTALYTGEQHQIVPNTTLNQKYSILSDAALNEGENPTVKYFGIGNGGHTMSNVNGVATPSNRTHRFRDCALFNQIPFVVREINNDISAAERAKFALRTRMTKGDSDYWVYWLKRIDPTTNTVVMEITNENDGASDTDEFVPSQDDLSPTPPSLENTSVIDTSGIKLTAKKIISLSLTPAEVEEIRNACEILFGTSALAIISEVAICSGVDRDTSISLADTSTVIMKEAIAVQVCHFLKGTDFLEGSNKHWGVTFDLGLSEPLIDAE